MTCKPQEEILKDLRKAPESQRLCKCARHSCAVLEVKGGFHTYDTLLINSGGLLNDQTLLADKKR